MNEDLIILLLWSSALFKMNAQSLIDLSLVIYWMIMGRSPRTMKLIMHTVAVVWLIRLCVNLSNMSPRMNPMVYPQNYLDDVSDPNKAIEKGYVIPWIIYF